MKKKTKIQIITKNFTLLEIVITIVLITTCLSFIGIKITDALYVQKYKNNLKKIDYYFAFSKKMAQTNQADIYLKIYQENMKTHLEIGTDEKMGFFLNSKKITDVLDDLVFTFNEKKIDNIEIVFSSSGNVFPKGKFVFLDRKNKFEEKRDVDLTKTNM
jgi:hypothetical protein